MKYNWRYQIFDLGSNVCKFMDKLTNLNINPIHIKLTETSNGVISVYYYHNEEVAPFN